jgi:hypothetical protein
MSSVTVLGWLFVTDFGEAMPYLELSLAKNLADSRHTKSKNKGWLQQKHQSGYI